MKQRAFERIISLLEKAGCLNHMILVASWAEFAFREAGILPGFVPTIRTLDVDFLERNLRRPNPPGVPRRIRCLATLQNPIALKLRSEPGGSLYDEARSLGQVLLVQNERLLMQCLKERALTIRYDRREQSVRRRRLAR